MIGFLQRRRTALLAVFLGAQLAVLAFVLAEQAWPRSVPEALGWFIFLGSYPWSMPWTRGEPEQMAATMIAIAAGFGSNVTLIAAAAGYALEKMRRRMPAR